MTKRHSFYIFLYLGLIVTLFPGCAKDADSPTSVVRSIQKGAGQPSDDTADSEITSPYYPQGTIVIAAIGDSITYGKGSSVGGYPPMLEQKLQAAGHNVVVLNEGIPGERAPETDERFLEVIAGADIVLIMIGMNDMINMDDDYYTIDYISLLMDKAVISKTIPLVSTVTPASSESDYVWVNPRVEELNGQIIQAVAARSPNVYQVDNYSAILSNGGNSLYDDQIHFNNAGYNVMADEWLRVLTEHKILDNLKK